MAVVFLADPGPGAGSRDPLTPSPGLVMVALQRAAAQYFPRRPAPVQAPIERVARMQTVLSVKGGVGVTVVAASVAAGWARRDGAALLVDLCGDAPAVLGLAEPDGPGVRDWLADEDSAPGALDRLVVDAGDGVTLLPAGTASVAPWSEARARSLAWTLAERDGHVVVDAGRSDGPSVGRSHQVLVDALVAAGQSVLVTRPCYLALRRAVHQRVVADGAVLVSEPGRSLDRRDVTQVLGLPVLAQVDLDPAVARAVDAGLLTRSAPRSLERSLRGLW